MSQSPGTDRYTAPVLAAIQSMQGTVTLARALSEGGRRIDLAGLDAEAARLCAAVAVLPKPAGQSLRPALLALLAEVEGLAGTLPAPEG
ncbi:hypothetical protein JYK14_27635 [Siccirubricoccus sp. KC 17139]|uniref:Uncharacterized protein n=1 Tax=Siccirubricoccus soli TaxID=2899147 RepID=A0ABT1DD97_9PROT|nr:hypothetical protein [Siccirubricoccus soli]MCO6419904.1 hypothetical protein [Siccirubricoccus soli]MCP2686039.1 hypothetical protein [Siccirubricoccus soli]